MSEITLHFHYAMRSNKSQRLSEFRDIFDTGTMKRKKTGHANHPQSHVYIRKVLPVEQTTAIAKSMLDRQSKPKDLSIVKPKGIAILGRDELRLVGEKRKRQNRVMSKNVKKTKKTK